MRCMPWLLSVSVRMLCSWIGAQKLGQPVPDSNLVSERNNSLPQHTQRYIPSSCRSQYLPVNAGSVPLWRVPVRVVKISDPGSDAYFATRALGSRFSALISRQSAVIASAAVLKEKLAKIAARYPEGNPPRPKHWGGYCVGPDEFEFWQAGRDRLHDRLRYRRRRDGSWKMERLSP